MQTASASLDVAGFAHFEQDDFEGSFEFAHADALQLFGQSSDGDPHPVLVHGDGAGQWRRQQWKIAGRVGEQDAIDAQAVVAFGDTIALDAGGDLNLPAFVLPQNFESLADERIAARFEGAIDPETSVVTADRITLDTDWAGVDASARIALDDEELTASVLVNINDAAPLGEWFDFDVHGTGTLTADIRGDASSTRLNARVALSEVERADVRIETAVITADGEFGPWQRDLLDSLTAKVEGSVGPVRFGDDTQDAVRLSARVARDDNGGFTLTGGTAGDDNLAAEFDGHASAGFERMEIHASASAASIAPYSAFAGEPYDGSLRLQLDAAYAQETGWNGSTTATLRDPTGFPDAAVAAVGSHLNLASDFSYADGALALDELTAESQFARVRGGASYAVDSQEFVVDVEGNTDDLGCFSDVLGQSVQGSARLGFRARGTLDAFHGTLQARADDAGVGEFVVAILDGRVEAQGAIDDLRADAVVNASTNDERLVVQSTLRYENSELTVDRLDAANGDNVLRASGVWNADGGVRALDVDASVPQLERVGRVVSVELRGEANVSLALDPNGEGALRVNANAHNLVTPYASLATLDATGEIARPFDSPRGRLEVTARDLERGDLRLTRLDGQAGFEQDVQFEAILAGDIQKSIPFDGALRGDWNSAERVLRVAELTGRLEEFPIALARPTQVVFMEDGVRIHDTSLTFGEGGIDVRGDWAPSRADVSAEWDALPLTALRVFEIPIATGTLSGNLALAGESGALGGTLVVAVRDLRSQAMNESAAPAAQMDVTATLRPDRVETLTRASMIDGGHAEMSFAFALSPGDTLVPRMDEHAAWNGAMRADLDLAAVPRVWITEIHDLTGRFTADVSLAGTPNHPAVTGGARLVDARYENKETGTILEGVNADIAGNNERLTLTRLAATDGAGGTLTAEGEASLAASEDFPFSARIYLAGVRPVQRDDLTGRVDGMLRAEGSLAEAAIAGKLTLTEANAIVRPSRTESIPKLDIVYANEPAPEEPPAEARKPLGLPDVALDISIDIPGRAFILAQDVNTEWQGNLHVGGTLELPIVQGTVHPVRGHIGFLGRRFTLTRESTIDFDTKESTFAYLDLTATTRRDDLDATLTIRGTLEQLDVDLTSSPPLSQDEVLSRVLFGKNVTEISPLQAFQMARAAAMLSGTLEGIPFFSGPSRLPIIDTLDIESGEEGAVLSVGKYLADNIFVEFETGSGVDAGRVRVELEVTPRISLETSVGANSQAGLGARWKYDY